MSSESLNCTEHRAAICSKNIDYGITCHFVKANHGSKASSKFWGTDKIKVSLRGGDTVN